MRSSKGSQFERQFCRELSLWWSNGESDDLFWRTAGSGGRATARKKQGKDTKNTSGDIAATDEVAFPFTRMFTLELKRGYPAVSPMTLLQTESKKPPMFFEWIHQAKESRRTAKSVTWAIIHKQDRRKAMIYMPASVFLNLEATQVTIAKKGNYLQDVYAMSMEFRSMYSQDHIKGFPLELFFQLVWPETIRQIITDWKPPEPKKKKKTNRDF